MYKKFYKIYYKHIQGANRGNLFNIKQRNYLLKNILKEKKIILPETKVLDIDCGNGEFLGFLSNNGVNFYNSYGVDIELKGVRRAKSRWQEINFINADASNLPFLDKSFDIIFAISMFNVILDKNILEKVISEMKRVIKDGGVIIIYDLRFFSPNPYNHHITKDFIEHHFCNKKIETYTLTLIPILARLLAPISEKLCDKLTKVKILNSHYLFVIKDEL